MAHELPAWRRKPDWARATYPERSVSVQVGGRNLVVAAGPVLVAVARLTTFRARVRGAPGNVRRVHAGHREFAGIPWTFPARSESEVYLARWGSHAVVPTALGADRLPEQPRMLVPRPDVLRMVG